MNQVTLSCWNTKLVLAVAGITVEEEYGTCEVVNYF